MIPDRRCTTEKFREVLGSFWNALYSTVQSRATPWVQQIKNNTQSRRTCPGLLWKQSFLLGNRSASRSDLGLPQPYRHPRHLFAHPVRVTRFYNVMNKTKALAITKYGPFDTSTIQVLEWRKPSHPTYRRSAHASTHCVACSLDALIACGGHRKVCRAQTKSENFGRVNASTTDFLAIRLIACYLFSYALDFWRFFLYRFLLAFCFVLTGLTVVEDDEGPGTGWLELGFHIPILDSNFFIWNIEEATVKKIIG